MKGATDQDYLTKVQYKNADNLRARMKLHECFSTNQTPWNHWVFDNIRFRPGTRVLELGTGPAQLWQDNLERLADSWRLTLTDLSEGMLQEARQALGKAAPEIHFERVDAQQIPFADNSFDIVIANHMLYHVPDLSQAIGEIRRVLTPQGHFYAATNGQTHMQELRQWGHEVAAQVTEKAQIKPTQQHLSFTLESGEAQLRQHFEQVTLVLYEDALIIAEVKPLMDYILSSRQWFMLSEGLEQAEAQLEALITAKLAGGPLHISKASGLFVAH